MHPNEEGQHDRSRRPPLIAVSFRRLFLGGLLPSRARFRFAGSLPIRLHMKVAQSRVANLSPNFRVSVEGCTPRSRPPKSTATAIITPQKSTSRTPTLGRAGAKIIHGGAQPRRGVGVLGARFLEREPAGAASIGGLPSPAMQFRLGNLTETGATRWHGGRK
jgi:hypothetical protein